MVHAVDVGRNKQNSQHFCLWNYTVIRRSEWLFTQLLNLILNSNKAHYKITKRSKREREKVKKHEREALVALF